MQKQRMKYSDTTAIRMITPIQFHGKRTRWNDNECSTQARYCIQTNQSERENLAFLVSKATATLLFGCVRRSIQFLQWSDFHTDTVASPSFAIETYIHDLRNDVLFVSGWVYHLCIVIVWKVEWFKWEKRSIMRELFAWMRYTLPTEELCCQTSMAMPISLSLIPMITVSLSDCVKWWTERNRRKTSVSIEWHVTLL